MSYSMVKHLYNSKEAIDIVFIAEGFTSSEINIFKIKVEQAIIDFFKLEPFNNNNKYNFNIYSIATISNESGISVLSHPNNIVPNVVKDTYWKTFFNRAGINSYIGIDPLKRVQLDLDLKKLFKNKVFPIMIVNSSNYGGGAELKDVKFSSLAIITMETQYNTFDKLMMHEFAHSFGKLDDEYEYTTVDYNKLLYAEPELIYGKNMLNTSDSPITDRKWDYLSNPQYIEGSRYLPNGKFRSSQFSLMRSWFQTGTTNDENFSELQIYLLNKRIQEELAYNKKVIAYYIKNNNIVYNKNCNTSILRVHDDNITIKGKRVFEEIYVAHGSTLNIEGDVYSEKVINEGTINGVIKYSKYAK